MTSQRSYRPPRSYATTSPWKPVDDGLVASVAGLDGTVVATICRRLESVDGQTDAADMMAVVAIDGDVDADTAPLLQQTLVHAIDERQRTLLDLHRAGFFGAAGVHVLLEAHRHATVHGRFFALRGVHGTAEQVLSIVGLDLVIPRIG